MHSPCRKGSEAAYDASQHVIQDHPACWAGTVGCCPSEYLVVATPQSHRHHYYLYQKVRKRSQIQYWESITACLSLTGGDSKTHNISGQKVIHVIQC